MTANREGLTVVKTKIEDPADDVRRNRRSFIGGSDVGSILGLNQYESAYTLWAKKTGLIPDQYEDNDAMMTGRDLEDYVARRWCRRYCKKVHRDNYRYSLAEYPYMVGHIDRWVVSENAGLECKTANSYQNKEYAAGRYPDNYYAQCQHYMAVTGADRWYLAVLCFPHLYTFEIQRDEEEIKALIEAEADFWQKVQEGIPPEVDGSESTTDTITRLYPKGNEYTVELCGQAMHDGLAPYFAAKAQVKELEGIIDEYENTLKAALQEANRGILDDYVISWPVVKSKRLDTKRLKDEHPGIYEKYLRETESRRFSIKKMKRKEIEVK